MPSGVSKRAQESSRQPKTGPREPKMAPHEAKSARNDLKRSPRGPKKRTRTARRKEDRTKSIPRPSWTPQGPLNTAQRRSRGLHLGSHNGTKTKPKTIKNRSENLKEKKIQDHLGPVLARSWVDLDHILRLILVKNHWKT